MRAMLAMPYWRMRMLAARARRPGLLVVLTRILEGLSLPAWLERGPALMKVDKIVR
jgi:hypothetical protein